MYSTLNRVEPTNRLNFTFINWDKIIFIYFQATKKGSIKPDVWFIFQKSKYIYDWEDGTFHTVEFPTDKPYEYYMEYKGYSDDEAIDLAEKEFGKNEMIMVSLFILVRHFLPLVNLAYTDYWYYFCVLCNLWQACKRYWTFKSAPEGLIIFRTKGLYTYTPYYFQIKNC